MSVPPVTVSHKESLYTAVERMYTASTGSILVVDDRGVLVGIITERDIIRLVAMHVIEKNPLVENVMTVDPITASPGETLAQALAKMREARIRHLPVIDKDRKPIGIVTMRDILETIAEALLIASSPRNT